MTMKSAAFTLTTLFTNALIVPSSHAADKPVIKRFEIRPAVCVVEKDTNCNSLFLFSWELAFPAEVCLTARTNSEVLVCNRSENFAVELEVNIENDSYFDLTPQQANYQRVSQRINVQELNKDVRILHRRIWSVF